MRVIAQILRLPTLDNYHFLLYIDLGKLAIPQCRHTNGKQRKVLGRTSDSYYEWECIWTAEADKAAKQIRREGGATVA